MKWKRILFFVSVAWTAGFAALAGEITPAGQKLAGLLDSMHVEQLWLAGHPVDWRTGEPSGHSVSPGTHTHCSAFAAAAAEKAGIYLLHPPGHSSFLLANAQQDWLRAAGTNQGWYAVSSPLQAQQLANQGQLVVVTFKNPNSAEPGHIAIVRPSTKSDEAIRAEGPQIIQAGARNYQSTSVRVGFAHHPGAFARGQLLYFAHPIFPPATPAAAGPAKSVH